MPEIPRDDVRVGDAGERAVVRLIDRALGPHAGAGAIGHDRVVVPRGDDAAVTAHPEALVACVDSIGEGNDWFPGWTPRDAIGHRALAVSLSDVAAMGAVADSALLAWRLPPGRTVGDVRATVQGISRLARRCGVEVIGGDVDIGPGPELLAVTALGHVPPHGAWRRQGALVGDRVWVVGALGLAGLGLELARRAFENGEPAPATPKAAEKSTESTEARTTSAQGTGGAAPVATTPTDGALVVSALAHHLRPNPLLDAVSRLRARVRPTACIDISDGLWLDAERLADASGVALDLVVPLPEMWGRWVSICGDAASARATLISAGDDYALLLTAPAGVDVSLALEGVAPARAIGVVTGGAPAVHLVVGDVRLNGRAQGYLHGERADRGQR